jgi:ribose 5-phosphate isomerase B
MKIYFASDHAGYELKRTLMPYVHSLGFETEDMGAFSFDPNDDYPDWIAKAARAVSDNPQTALGIVIGGSGQGEAIVANKFRHVRAVVFNGQYRPRDGRKVPDEILLSREHNDANILSLGARFLDDYEAKAAVKEWLETQYSVAGRHKRRLAKIEKLERPAPRESFLSLAISLASIALILWVGWLVISSTF